MSIRNIDTQIMMQRTTDVAREASNMQRAPGAAQEHMAAQSKLESQLDQSRVRETTESDMDNIRTDEDGGGGGAAGGDDSRSDDNTDDEEIPPELRVPPGNEVYMIDISV